MKQLDFTLSLIDKLTRPIKQAQASVTGFADKSQAVFKKIAIGGAGLFATAIAIKDALSPAIEMNDALLSASAQGVSDATLKQVAANGLKFSIQYGKSALEFVQSTEIIKRSVSGLSDGELPRMTTITNTVAAALKTTAADTTEFMGQMFANFRTDANALGNVDFAERVAGKAAYMRQAFGTEMATIKDLMEGAKGAGTNFGIGMDEQMAVLIPAGTLVQTERINGLVYSVRVLADTTLDAGSLSGLVPVEASGTGGAFNLAPGYYRILPVAVSGIERAENEENWLLTLGADAESDDDLRDRCRNQYNLVGNYHTDAVYRSMIAAVAGLSIDRIFFLHDAPRGPGTANAYLLLDSGVISAPFITAVNDYITAQGHHGHGDDMQCMAMPETQHCLTLTVYVNNLANVTDETLTALLTGCENLVRCAFRENSAFDVKKTWPYARFSFSNLARELHRHYPLIDSLHFSLDDIVSDLSVPRLASLSVVPANA